MKKIWKYELGYGDTKLELPEDAVVRAFQIQNTVPTIWVELDPQAPKVMRTFTLYWTGSEVEGEYLGTVQQDNIVYHLYEGES